jgi:hypothetical protein
MAAVKRFSQVLDRGVLYNGQSAWFDKSTLDTHCGTIPGEVATF